MLPSVRLPAEAIKDISDGLSGVEALAVGDQILDIGMLAQYAHQTAVVGGYADYQYRVQDNIALFARAEGGMQWGPNTSTPFARGIAGVRFRF